MKTLHGVWERVLTDYGLAAHQLVYIVTTATLLLGVISFIFLHIYLSLCRLIYSAAAILSFIFIGACFFRVQRAKRSYLMQVQVLASSPRLTTQLGH